MPSIAPTTWGVVRDANGMRGTPSDRLDFDGRASVCVPHQIGLCEKYGINSIYPSGSLQTVSRLDEPPRTEFCPPIVFPTSSLMGLDLFLGFGTWGRSQTTPA
ncbi:MAG: hypothetical protein QGG09_19760, partial [Pirellulaceae bacterium]|nr:hypothetical protein [Pirellulaceae bacterium]